MRTLLKNATIFRDRQFEKTDLLMEDGLIISIYPNLPINDTVDSVFFLDGTYLAPSFYGEIAATWYNGDLVYTREGFHEG